MGGTRGHLGGGAQLLASGQPCERPRKGEVEYVLEGRGLWETTEGKGFPLPREGAASTWLWFEENSFPFQKQLRNQHGFSGTGSFLAMTVNLLRPEWAPDRCRCPGPPACSAPGVGLPRQMSNGCEPSSENSSEGQEPGQECGRWGPSRWASGGKPAAP